MMEQHYLAVDLGAESGRGILGSFDGQRLCLREMGRFVTGRGREDLGSDGIRRWDFARIRQEVFRLLAAAENETNGALNGIGVDSWGVDFGLLDAEGKLLEPPIQYRDDRHALAMHHAHMQVAPDTIWAATGIQFMPFNTLYQLIATQERNPGLLAQAAHLLLMPDLLHHYLTGGTSLLNEITNASTSQMLNPVSKQWDHDLISQFGLPSHFLGTLTAAGSRLGVTANGVPVYAPATHDTASAVLATPADPSLNWAFLSSGTWSLLGVELPAPILSQAAQQMGLSNESGAAGTTRLLKNIMGLWLVQEVRRSLLQTEGREYSYPELAALAEAAPAGGSIVDAAAHRFLAPPDMVQEIHAACLESGQTPPDDIGSLIRCCLDSLAHAYQKALSDLERLLGRKFDVLHIVGGGSNNRLLNQLTANACGIPVITGPGEATAIGNVLGQLVASCAVADFAQAREVARASFPVETFEKI